MILFVLGCFVFLAVMLLAVSIGLYLKKGQLQNKVEELRDAFNQLKQEHIKLETSADMRESILKEQLATQDSLKQTMSLVFEKLSNELMDKRGKELSHKNQSELSLLLLPFKEQLSRFSQSLLEIHQKDIQERAELGTEIRHLKSLNQKISEDAINLTNALHGQVKTQGCWGELILERTFECCGLIKGKEYDTQVALRDDKTQKLYQPDAIIYLPDDRHIIVDSKVSLTAYNNYCAADTEQDKTRLIKEHIQSIKNHIKQLSDKNYQKLLGEKTLDFVLLFMPIESAFALAISAEEKIISDALNKNILLVTPTTLLATLRTIENLWRIEKQNKNTENIIEKAGDLYDKFAGFCNDMVDVGKRISLLEKTYDSAYKKLRAGRGSITNKMEDLKNMGVRTTKKLPAQLSEVTEED